MVRGPQLRGELLYSGSGRPRRRAAVRCAAPGREVIDDVEAEIDARNSEDRPAAHFDPIELGGVIVSIVNPTWLTHTKRRKAKKDMTAAELAAEEPSVRRTAIASPPLSSRR